MPQLIKDREIFASGTWRPSNGGSFAADGPMLDRIVSNFQTLNSVPGFNIPVKLGHTNTPGAPAYGWAQNVRRSGDTILADLADVPDELVDMISNRRYNSVSIEIYQTFPYNGKEYRDVLRAVSLLGAEWPAVKGLKPLSADMFAASGVEVLELRERETMTTFTQDQVDAMVAAAVAEANRRVDMAEAALDTFRDDAAVAQIDGLIKTALANGQLVPAQEAQMRNLAKAFAGKLHVKAKFGDKEQTPIEMLTEFVGSMPKRVSFGEKGKSVPDVPGAEGSAAQEVNDKAQARIVANPKLSYKDALAQVFAEDPTLKTRYAEEA